MKRLVFLIGWAILTSSLFAQGTIGKRRTLSDKVFFGGNLGLQFGTVTSIDVSPIGGYRPIDDLYLGLGLSYKYYKDNSYLDLSTQIYGGSIFARYVFFTNFFVHTEFEELNLEQQYFDALNKYPDQNRFWIGSFLVGGGYIQPLGERTAATITILFNLNESANSPYQNPIVRIGFNF